MVNITGLGNTHQKSCIMVTHRPWKTWFWCPLSSENAVATFPHLLEMSSTCYPNGLEIGARGRSGTRKLVKMRLKIITSNVKKHFRFWSKNVLKRVQHFFVFVVFQGHIPAWSLGRPCEAPGDQKHVKMEARTWIFWYLWTMLSLSLETLWNISCVPRTNW
jgi:hypothetical protein